VGRCNVNKERVGSTYFQPLKVARAYRKET
jgi:hypothetical protein